MALTPCIVGLDIGTTSLKAVVYTTAGHQVTSASHRVETTFDDLGAATQDPDTIYQGVLAVLSQVTASAKDSGYAIKAIGFSSAMHSMIPVTVNGTLLFPAMTWLDSRPHEQAQSLWRQGPGRDIYACTGTPVHAMSPIAKLAWLGQNHPEIVKKAHHFVSIKEYVWHRWFDAWEVDYAIASATGLFDIHSFTWNESALSYAGISADQLSNPVSTSHLRMAQEATDLTNTGLSRDVVVCIGGSDGVLSNLAAGALDAKTLVFTVGTSLALRTGATKPAVNADIRSFCYILDEKHYVVGGPSNSGGVVLDWLYHQVMTSEVTQDGSDSEFVQLCEQAGDVDTEDLFFLPYISGERAPLWNERASGTFIGLKSYQNRTHLMRAAMEGILFNAYWIAEGLFRQVGKPERTIVSGKLFANAWVRTFVANLFGTEIHSEESVDGATFGAAILAARASDTPFPKKANANESSVAPMTKPDMSRHADLIKRYERYRRFCDVLMDA